MLRQCNQCRWYKHRKEWSRLCFYVVPGSGAQQSWLAEGGGRRFGLTCTICRDAYQDAPVKSPYVEGTKGAQDESQPEIGFCVESYR